MESRNSDWKQPSSFSELLERSRLETPSAPDLSIQIRKRLEEATQLVKLGWRDLLLAWTEIPVFKAGFAAALALLTLCACLELSRPDPQPQPPMPTFLVDRLFSE